METTPLDGYKKIIITILTLIAAALPFIIHDPDQAQAAGAFLVDVIGAAIISIVGTVYVIRQASIDKEKVIAAPKIASIAAQSAQAPSPKAEIVPTQQLPVAPILPAAVDAEAYKPVDLVAYVTAAQNSVSPGEATPDALGLAYKFYAPILISFDLGSVPRQYRVSESKRFVEKALELFKVGFTSYTKLSKPPTVQQASDVTAYMEILKKDYEKAMSVPCSNRTFDELKNVVRFFNDLYSALAGLNKLEGKTLDWSVFQESGGADFSGGAGYNPLMVGWDYAKLL